ncbi:MAG: AtpZ/AtpI family protein [Phycisphaerae bacterium]
MPSEPVPRDPRGNQDDPTAWLRYAGMGGELAGAIIGLTLFGYWVDWKFGTAPVGVATGAILGIIGGMYNFLRRAIRLTQRQFGSRPAPRPTSEEPGSNDRDDATGR